MSQPADRPDADGESGAPMLDFDARVLADLRRVPFFRLATDEEVSRTHAAYQAARASGDFRLLLEAWRASCEPTRATLDPFTARLYRNAGRAPRLACGLSFLATQRAALDEGRRFQRRLRPTTAATLQRDFPWLEHRHEHIPPGYTPRLSYPDGFARFIDGDTLDDARLRWQLVCALNEVQQSTYSRFLAAKFDLPELHQHAAREDALALHYFARWAPPASLPLWRQSILVLDALNAAVLAMACRDRAVEVTWHAMLGTVTGRAEWRAFVRGLGRPQRLL